MPLTDAREFGAFLRRERERQGITLHAIAEQTKVGSALLAGLERGDLSRWPTGIYRRAFVRSYAEAVGLDADRTLSDFLLTYPEDGSPSRRLTSAAGPGLRLTLAESGRAGMDTHRAAGVAIDLAVAGVAALAGYGAGSLAGALLAVLVVLPVWHATGTVLWGMSPGMRLWSGPPRPGARPRVASETSAQPVAAPRPAVVATPAPAPVAHAPVAHAPVAQPTPVAAEPARASVVSIATGHSRRTSRRDRRVVVRAERDARRSPHH